jgi:hypothetical protein
MTQFIFSDRLLNVISKTVRVVMGAKPVAKERFKYLNQIKSHIGGFDARAIGATYLDTQTGLYLFAERSVFKEMSCENGVIVERPACLVQDIFILPADMKMEGCVVNEKTFRAMLKRPETNDEKNAGDALYEQFRRYFTARPNRVFIDHTGRTGVSQTAQYASGFMRYAFG